MIYDVGIIVAVGEIEQPAAIFAPR
jgi:hypothetical protein